MKILIITGDELNEKGQQTLPEFLSLSDVRESSSHPKLYDPQGVARVCDIVIVILDQSVAVIKDDDLKDVYVDGLDQIGRIIETAIIRAREEGKI